MEKKIPTPEEMAKIERERVLNDADLLRGGAEYKFGENGEKRLDLTAEQMDVAEYQMGADLNIRQAYEERLQMVLDGKKNLQELYDEVKWWDDDACAFIAEKIENIQNLDSVPDSKIFWLLAAKWAIKEIENEDEHRIYIDRSYLEKTKRYFEKAGLETDFIDQVISETEDSEKELFNVFSGLDGFQYYKDSSETIANEIKKMIEQN